MRQAGQLQFGFFHSLGIFLLKKDTDSKEQQPDIHAQGIIVNVNKVIFYLILRPGAVLPLQIRKILFYAEIPQYGSGRRKRRPPAGFQK